MSWCRDGSDLRKGGRGLRLQLCPGLDQPCLEPRQASLQRLLRGVGRGRDRGLSGPGALLPATPATATATATAPAPCFGCRWVSARAGAQISSCHWTSTCGATSVLVGHDFFLVCCLMGVRSRRGGVHHTGVLHRSCQVVSTTRVEMARSLLLASVLDAPVLSPASKEVTLDVCAPLPQ